MNNIKADLLVRDRYDHPEGGIVEIVVWLLHLYKYRLVYVVQGKRVIGYDNERGKGDHYHFGNEQFDYVFIDLDTLFADFAATITRWNHGHRHF